MYLLKFLLGMAVATVPAFCHSAVNLLDQAMYPGTVTAFYGKMPSDGSYADLMNSMQASQMSETLAGFAASALKFRRNLRVGISQCGYANAFYTRTDSTITVCLELIEIIRRLGAERGADRTEEGKKFMAGIIIGIYVHELAHALIDINQIPITGREEDVADQFLVYYGANFIAPSGFPSVLPTAWFFEQISRYREVSGMDAAAIRRLLADEHTLDQSRVYSIVCWAYGAKPIETEKAVRAFKLPIERQGRCAAEYARLSAGIGSQFGKYIRKSHN